MRNTNYFVVSTVIAFLIAAAGVISMSYKMANAPKNEHSAVTQELHTYINDVYSSESVPYNLIPNSFPDDFVITKKKSFEDDMDIIASIYFETTDAVNSFVYRIHYHLTDDAVTYYEKDDGNVKQIEKDGIIYYLFSNLDTNSVVWRNGSFESQIDGNISQELLKEIIDSIPSR